MWKYAFLLSLLFQSKWWKEKQLEKMLINLCLGENSTLRGLKEWRTLLNLLFASMMDPLTFNCYLGVRFSSDRW